MNTNKFDQLKREPQEKSEKHKFQEDFCQTYEAAFKWRFGDYIESGKRAFKNMMTWEVIEESGGVYEIKVADMLVGKDISRKKCSRHRLRDDMLQRFF